MEYRKKKLLLSDVDKVIYLENAGKFSEISHKCWELIRVQQNYCMYTYI